MDSKCSPTLATLAWRHIPILILRSSDCARYQGWRPSGSVSGRIHRGSFSVTANSGDSQSISVYGLKLRRTDPSDSVASMLTYSASSRTSMLLRQRRTNRVLAISRPPQRGLHLDVLCPDSTAGTGYSLHPARQCDLTGGHEIFMPQITRHQTSGRARAGVLARCQGPAGGAPHRRDRSAHYPDEHG